MVCVCTEIQLGALHCFTEPSLQLKGLETKGGGAMEVEQTLFQGRIIYCRQELPSDTGEM